MEQIYDRNGLIFWDEKEIGLRRYFTGLFASYVYSTLLGINDRFRVMEIEAPLLTPMNLINPNYTREDVWFLDKGDLVLRPETTPGSYEYAVHLLASQKILPPFCIWQAGKSFRKEQDQVTKHMRLKEFYQQEFQCIYTSDTANDYHSAILPAIEKMIRDAIGLPTRVVQSDRLPSYSQITSDVEVDNGDKWMEVCSISRRIDFPAKATFSTKKGAVEKDLLVLEIAIGLDRCVYNYNERCSRA